MEFSLHLFFVFSFLFVRLGKVEFLLRRSCSHNGKSNICQGRCAIIISQGNNLQMNSPFPTQSRRLFYKAYSIDGETNGCHFADDISKCISFAKNVWISIKITPKCVPVGPIDNKSTSQIAKFMGPTWGPPGSCRPQVGPMLAPWSLLSGFGSDNGLAPNRHQSIIWSNDCLAYWHIYIRPSVQMSFFRKV